METLSIGLVQKLGQLQGTARFRSCHWIRTSMSLGQASSGAMRRTSTFFPLRSGETALAPIHLAWIGKRILFFR